MILYLCLLFIFWLGMKLLAARGCQVQHK